MAAAAPALLSGLAEKLLRRPPSLRELAVIAGYAEGLRMVRGAGAPPLPRRCRGDALGPRRAHEGGVLYKNSSPSATSPSTPPTSSSASTSGTSLPGHG